MGSEAQKTIIRYEGSLLSLSMISCDNMTVSLTVSRDPSFATPGQSIRPVT
jgi:hypothetical protein